MFENIIDGIKTNYYMFRYRNKMKKLNLSPSLISFMSSRMKEASTQDLVKIINKSKNKDSFKENITKYIKENPNELTYNTFLLIGNLTGYYSVNSYSVGNKVNLENIENFNTEGYEEVYNSLKEHFYDYVMNNNDIKNKIQERKDGVKDLASDISKEYVDKFFDDVLLGNDKELEGTLKASIVYKYVYNTVNKYTIDDILNNYDFIEYDMDKTSSKSINERREEFNKNKDIDLNYRLKVDDMELLKNRLMQINNPASNELLGRLSKIEDPFKNKDELEDIYLDYERIFREDIVDHLYVPTEKETIIDNYKDVKPQLIHLFIRSFDRFKGDLEEKLVDQIISERNNKDDSRELTTEEQERYNNLLNRLDVELNPTQVNYSGERVGKYSDSTGLSSYMSDTTNQIATSIYSESFFNNRTHQMIGIGFNQEGLLPEAIALSSSIYQTTNKGMNNIEISNNEEFKYTSASYLDLVKNDGNSEVVLFRRNMDFDTKASYVFVAFDSNNQEKANELIEEGRKLAQENNMKLVLFDTVKISNSYKADMVKNENIIENNKGMTK